jgi:hypothetical protein
MLLMAMLLAGVKKEVRGVGGGGCCTAVGVQHGGVGCIASGLIFVGSVG